jgi:hypothetical protein
MLGAVVPGAGLPMRGTGEEVPRRRAVALPLIGAAHPGRVGQAVEPRPEEFLGRLLGPPTLHQNIADGPLLIHGAPEMGPLTR